MFSRHITRGAVRATQRAQRTVIVSPMRPSGPSGAMPVGRRSYFY